MILIPIQVAIVVTINELVDFANESNPSTTRSKIPIVSITAPNVKAHITNQIVFNILTIPPLVNKSSTTPTPLFKANPEWRAVQTPESIVRAPLKSGRLTKLLTMPG